MLRSIATVSISGTLPEKLHAIAAAGDVGHTGGTGGGGAATQGGALSRFDLLAAQSGPNQTRHCHAGPRRSPVLPT